MSGTIPVRPRHPWDRQRGEPKEAYVRFLFYRNLGPARSIEAAQQVATGSDEKRPASGQWSADSSRWDWPDRAHDWDLSQLALHGEGIAAAFIEALRLVAMKCVAKLAKSEPANWDEAVKSLQMVGGHVSEETLRVMARRAADAKKARHA